MPAFIAIALIEMVGGPPISTAMPIGIASSVVLGKTSDLVLFFFFGRSGAGMPMSWQGERR
jgi:hypothetical protein